MGRRSPARLCAGGGEGIPASRPTRARVVVGAAAVVLLLAGAATLPLRVDRFAPLVAVVGIAAAVFLLAALAGRWAGLLPWALALAGAEYAVFLVIQQDTIDAYAPLYAAGLLLVAELAYWSVQPLMGSQAEDGLGRRRTSLVVAAVVAAGGIGGVILTMAELSVGGGLGLELLGVAAAVASLAIVGVLAARQS